MLLDDAGKCLKLFEEISQGFGGDHISQNDDRCLFWQEREKALGTRCCRIKILALQISWI